MNSLKSKEAKELLSPYLTATPLLFSKKLSQISGKNIWLKLETQQPTGSFKVRPAFHSILTHLAAARSKGVMTTSSGNFAQAVAYAAKELGVKAAIVMTEDTSPLKIRRTQELEAEVIFCENTFESRFEVLNQLSEERGSYVLHGFDSEETIAGNGTLALELIDHFKEEDFAVFCPASGGGLISGIASVLNELKPSCTIHGFQPEGGGAIVHSLRAGERVNIGKVRSIADALVASMPGERTFKFIRKHVNSFDLVSEYEIIEGLRVLFDDQKLVVEPGGAVGVAGLISNKVRLKQKNVVCVISGGNIESTQLCKLLHPQSD